MFEQLRWYNESVGQATLEDIYGTSPREFDAIVAGSLKRSYNQLSDSRFALGNTILPMVMIDPSKFDDGQIKQALKEQLESIKALTDQQLQKKLTQQKAQQKRFMDIFMNKQKGGKSKWATA